jgi:hypothetical protein
MAIRDVVTRGYGTNSFDGSIPFVVTRGYTPSSDAPPEPAPEEVVVVAPVTDTSGGGIEEYMQAFARERAFERRVREEAELMKLAAFDDEIVGTIMRKLFGLN